jgi:hypothetical protein
MPPDYQTVILDIADIYDEQGGVWLWYQYSTVRYFSHQKPYYRHYFREEKYPYGEHVRTEDKEM